MPGGKTPGPSIKWPSLYEKLLGEGKSKSQAAAISNAAWRKRKGKKLKKHRPGGQDHDQDDHGRWSRGVSAGQIESRTRAEGGSTQRLETGNLPERGFAVGITEFSSGAIENPTLRDFQDYMRLRADELAKPGRHLGTWIDTDTGEVWLDVVDLFTADNYTDALDAAATHAFEAQGEKAIWDLLNDDEIRPDNLADYRSRLGSDGLLIDAAA